MKFTVTVQSTAIVEAYITIDNVASKEEAEKAALKKAQRGGYEQIGWEVTEVEMPPDVIRTEEE